MSPTPTTSWYTAMKAVPRRVSRQCSSIRVPYRIRRWYELARMNTPRRIVRTLLLVLGAALALLCAAQNLGLLATLADDVPAGEKAALRRAWREEAAAHARLAERQARYRAEWDAERAREEARRRDVERRRMGVYWTTPEGDARCRAYGTRAYRAVLEDVPEGLGWLEVCSDMPVVIHGRRIEKPDECRKDVSAC